MQNVVLTSLLFHNEVGRTYKVKLHTYTFYKHKLSLNYQLLKVQRRLTRILFTDVKASRNLNISINQSHCRPNISLNIQDFIKSITKQVYFYFLILNYLKFISQVEPKKLITDKLS